MLNLKRISHTDIRSQFSSVCITSSKCLLPSMHGIPHTNTTHTPYVTRIQLYMCSMDVQHSRLHGVHLLVLCTWECATYTFSTSYWPWYFWLFMSSVNKTIFLYVCVWQTATDRLGKWKYITKIWNLGVIRMWKCIAQVDIWYCVCVCAFVSVCCAVWV